MPVKISNNTISYSLTQIERKLVSLPKDAYDFWRGITPIRSGNARNKTKLVNNKTIEANYPYAERLDEGYSKQAPRGMSEPTDKFIKNRLRNQIIRK